LYKIEPLEPENIFSQNNIFDGISWYFVKKFLRNHSLVI